MFLEIIFFFVLFWAVLSVLSALMSPKRMKLEGSHVLITGGSSGIGKALAIQVVKQGGNVTLLARSLSKLKEADAEIQKHVIDTSKQKICIRSVDIAGDYGAVENAVHEVEASIGPVDMLVNCAGIPVLGKFEDIPLEEFKRVMNVNYFGSLHATRAVIRGMKARQNGRIVFLSSIAGQIGLFGYTGYSASKFAVRGLAESLRMEVKPYNIFVTIAFPPDTDTPALVEENKCKPKETRLISESGGFFSPDTVADNILRDAVHGKFLCSIGMEGFIMSTLTCGMTPVISIGQAIIQVVLLSFSRVISLVVLYNFDRIVNRCKLDDERVAKELKKE